MNLATEEPQQQQEPVRASNRTTKLGGTDIFRGALVILTAIIIGGFVVSRGIDGGNADQTASPDENAIDAGSLTGADEAGGATDSTLIDDGGILSPSEATTSDPAAPTVEGTADNTSDGTADGAADGTATEADGSTADGGTGEVLPEGAASEAPAFRPPAEVKVLVLNGAQTQGIAAKGTERLLAAAYKTGAPKNADRTQPSVILFNEGYQAEALAVAAVFGPGLEGLVQPADPANLPIGDTQEANVIVVIGTDNLIPL